MWSQPNKGSSQDSIITQCNYTVTEKVGGWPSGYERVLLCMIEYRVVPE